MTLEDNVQRTRLRVLQRAKELGNVSAACREAGISRTLFYRWKKRFANYGIDGLHPRRTSTRPGRRIQLDSTKERKIVAIALAWQLTAWDAARSYAMAKVVPANNATETAEFLRDVVAVEIKKAGWKLRRLLTDGGSEFKGQFDVMCCELGVRHTRTQPRHAWTNGLVEQLQGTILHEHWKIVFRRRCLRRRHQLQSPLASFIEFYNFKRPHQGY
ncbi:transposase [Candidatus Bipolaricaulota bacterium]|nr:transposase [Candidatus Bipolaricaulota bacterium]